MFFTASQVLVLCLILIAGIVAIGLAMKKNMWKFIILYWVTLTLKNITDLLKI